MAGTLHPFASRDDAPHACNPWFAAVCARLATVLGEHERASVIAAALEPRIFGEEACSDDEVGRYIDALGRKDRTADLAALVVERTIAKPARTWPDIRIKGALVEVLYRQTILAPDRAADLRARLMASTLDDVFARPEAAADFAPRPARERQPSPVTLH